MATGLNNLKIKPKPIYPHWNKPKGNLYKKVPIPPAEFALTQEEIADITEKNIGMVWSIVHKWGRRNRGIIDTEDLFQEAMYGWTYGAERYDKRRRGHEGQVIKPQSYMMHWALSFVRKYVRSQITRGFHVPRMHEKGGIRLPQPASLEMSRGSSGAEIRHFLAAKPDDRGPEFPDDFWDRVNKFLSLNQRIAIDLRYRRGMTLQEIGVLMGVAREAVRLWEAEALRRIKARKILDSTFREHQ